ncbi:MAG: hypothetical protein M3P11_04490 [Actinomycetota bacterium]|nr:hypothetical protein [Actinomycetota bacterium]
MRQEAWTFAGSEWTAREVPSRPVEEPTWVDVELRSGEEAKAFFASAWMQDSFPRLLAKRAAKGGALPPTDPPSFHVSPGWVFGRLYWLDKRKESPRGDDDQDLILVAQEIHVVSSSSLAVTVRYPLIHWHATDPTTPRAATPGLGLPIERLKKETAELAEAARSTDGFDFASAFLTTLLGRVTSSYFDALGFVRSVADIVEGEVSGLEMPDSVRTRRDILNLRRLLRQLRWAFVPEDETHELLSWPSDQGRNHMIDVHLADAEAESSRAVVTTRDLMEQVQQTFDLLTSIKQDTIEATTYRLTMVATLLLPPSLIAGMYGMNFRYMPFLSRSPAVFITLAAMIASSVLGWFVAKRRLPIPGHRATRDSRS